MCLVKGGKAQCLLKLSLIQRHKLIFRLDEIEPKLRYRSWQFYQLPNNLHVLPLKAQQSTSDIEAMARAKMLFSSDIKLLSTYTRYMDDRNEKNHQHLTSMLNTAVNRLGSEINGD